MIYHVPVLVEESKRLLITRKEGIYFDGTIGYGGHSEKFLEILSKKSKLIGTDKDYNAFKFCEEKFKNDKRVTVYHTSFIDIDKISKIEFIEKYDGIFADLGVSSFQLDNPEAGFTFREEANLDLRMNKNQGVPASEIINLFSENDLAKIFFDYGEEKNSKKIAREIVKARKLKAIKTTAELRFIIERITNRRYLTKTLSRIFQALRIFVNNELEELKIFLEKSIDLLAIGGRMVVLSYHSLEDRIVKEKFKLEASDCICPPGTPICVCGKKKRVKILTPKPIVALKSEIEINKRARSVKLRAIEKIA
ncbi:16S rRNA (cytosine(1402)-N(4))-methyltransferase RsmH [Melioribacteraceae bacterium 4301-Me]|uniref:16S rRNA (cytosine(1402)-N(4))-methyltransferase RsmH n=1 Tax=Pyranulibacter aquaticus TaxID=3163344 RepID=UPI00359A49B6